MEIVLLILFFISMAANAALAAKVAYNHAHPIVKTQYKEIEVVKKAICECDHESSKHNNSGCQQQMFTLDGNTTTKSYKCFCTKYVGPIPMTQYFDDQMRELESVKIK